MTPRFVRTLRAPILAVPVLAAMAAGGVAADIRITVAGAPEDVAAAVRAASLLAEAKADKTPDPQDLFAAAQADYGRILGALYAEGHYGGVVHILIDGREAADIAPLDAPSRIGRVLVRVEAGPVFTFAKARMRPYAPGTNLPPAYGDTKIARSAAITEAAEAGVAGWRAVGHAKARVGDQRILADHGTGGIDALLLLEPGPKVRFGRLEVAGYKRIRPARLTKIAGFPTGEVFDPVKAQRVADRVRRSGVFRAVSLAEAERVNADGTLDFTLTVDEEKRRRFGLGAEVLSDEGLALTGYWLHRNLSGGGERLRFDFGVTGIGATSGTDYTTALRFDRPATPDADTTFFAAASLGRTDNRDYVSRAVSVSSGFTRTFSPELTASLGLGYDVARVSDAAGVTTYQALTLPFTLTWDRRDQAGNPTKGTYLAADAKPFLGFGGTGSGVRLYADGRVYRGFGKDDQVVVLAARAQVGTVAGPTLAATPRDYLFYSGGGGTVRGQPFQSLGVNVLPGGVTSGGQSFAAVSGEVRVAVTEKIGVVGFYDAGYVSAADFFGGGGAWQSGAGVGVRYDTAIGPVRLDVGVPVSGGKGGGAQVYIGIGQAF